MPSLPSTLALSRQTARKRTAMAQAALVGHPEFLTQAFPPSLRRELAEHFDFSLAEQTDKTIRGADLREIEILFGTWDMPRLDRSFLEAAPKLRAIFYAAGTVKYFVTPEAFARGLTICGAWRANAIPVAEYTVSAIVLSLKKFWQVSRLARESACDLSEMAIPGVYRKKVGLVSLGAIGIRVAEMLAAYDLEVMAYDPYGDPALAARLGVELVPLESLFRECDVVSIHAPLLPETVKLVSAPLVRSMREGATLINTARGAVLDEEPVLEALQARPDLTALLDVVVTEPPAKESLILRLPNVVYTPHLAGSRGSEIARMGEWMAEEARRFQVGEPLLHEITLEMLNTVA